VRLGLRPVCRGSPFASESASRPADSNWKSRRRVARAGGGNSVARKEGSQWRFMTWSRRKDSSAFSVGKSGLEGSYVHKQGSGTSGAPATADFDSWEGELGVQDKVEGLLGACCRAQTEGNKGVADSGQAKPLICLRRKREEKGAVLQIGPPHAAARIVDPLLPAGGATPR